MNEKPVAVPLLLCCLGPIILSSALAGLGGSLGALDSFGIAGAAVAAPPAPTQAARFANPQTRNPTKVRCGAIRPKSSQIPRSSCSARLKAQIAAAPILDYFTPRRCPPRCLRS
jgi:hypothetical protein